MNHCDNNRTWRVLSWNVRGLNSDRKLNDVKDKIVESKYDVICLQETKKDSFERNFIKNIAHVVFNKYSFLPSRGASGGTVVIWKGSLFDGELFFSK
jgi:exonuclease III